MLCRQAIALRELRIPRCAAAQRRAFGQQVRPGRPMDGPVHTPAAKEGAIGGIHNRIDLQPGNIAFDYFDHEAYDRAPRREAFQMETVRAFIAVDIGDDIRSRLDELQRRLKKVHANVRWVKPHGMHLTLVFLGDVPIDQLDTVKVALEQACRGQAPFALKASGTGFFGKPKYPRVIWAGVTDSPSLEALQRHIVEQLHGADLAFDNKPFSPHLTLGRIKGIDQHTAPLLQKVEKFREADLGTACIDQVDLMQSELGPHGAKHALLHRVELRPPS